MFYFMALIKKTRDNKLLARRQGKGNTSALLMGMQNAAATMENSVEVLQKQNYYMIQQVQLWDYTQKK